MNEVTVICLECSRQEYSSDVVSFVVLRVLGVPFFGTLNTKDHKEHEDLQIFCVMRLSARMDEFMKTDRSEHTAVTGRTGIVHIY